MTQAIRPRRVIIATLILTAALMTFPIGRQAHAMSISGKTTLTTTTNATSTTVCAVAWRKGTLYVKRLVRCAARFYGVSVDKALYIANRESNFRPRAYNSWSCAKGIYQHLCRYWPGRATTYGFRDKSAYNARANIMVTMRMVKRYGWSPWGG
jgi:soluble lytic murein transglycosylase-like protein